jgi:predicted ferric reductase
MVAPTMLAGPAGRADGPRPAGSMAGARLAVRVWLSAGGCAVVARWWSDTPAASLGTFGAQLTAAGRVAGLLAAYLVLVQLLLMSRLPWFERAVGFDRLAAWHRGLGTNVVLLIVTHVLTTVWGYGLTLHHAPASELVTIITTYPDEWKATAGVLLFVAIGITSARFARQRVSYEAWYWLHLTAYVAVALTFFHQESNGADFVGHPGNRLGWTLLYTAVAGCLIVWRLGVPAVAMAHHRMTVERVVPEAPGVVSVWIKGRYLDEMAGAAGQFLLWRFLAPGHLLTAHPYSLSAMPTPTRLRITVKDLGDHSRALAHLPPGTAVLAEGPFGHFTAARASRAKVLLIGGGSGIAPVRALAEEFVRGRCDVVIVYRASRPADLALGRELAALAEGGRASLHWVVGTRRDLGHDPLSAPAIRAAVPDAANRDVYLCGPAGMTRAVTGALRRLGVRDDQIHTEEFAL